MKMSKLEKQDWKELKKDYNYFTEIDDPTEEMQLYWVEKVSQEDIEDSIVEELGLERFSSSKALFHLYSKVCTFMSRTKVVNMQNCFCGEASSNIEDKTLYVLKIEIEKHPSFKMPASQILYEIDNA